MLEQLQRPVHPSRARTKHGLYRSETNIRLLLSLLLAVVSVFPLLYMLSLSFQPVGAILSFPPVFIPGHPTLVNYVQAWLDNNFNHYFLNSLLISLGTVAGTLLLASFAAYGFARYNFLGKDALFYYLLASMAVPAILLIMPQYVLMKELGLIDSRFGLTLLYVSANLPLTTFLLRGFFAGIPKELEEAMRLDGVSEFGLLPRLVIPLSMPAFMTAGMLTFNGAWDEFALALTMINTPSKRTLPIALALFQGAHTTAWGPLFAASMIATLPSIVVFGVTQRWFQEGMSVTVPQ